MGYCYYRVAAALEKLKGVRPKKVATPLLHKIGANKKKRLPPSGLSITFVIDLTVAVNVSFPDHLVDLLVRELLTKVGHHVP